MADIDIGTWWSIFDGVIDAVSIFVFVARVGMDMASPS